MKSPRQRHPAASGASSIAAAGRLLLFVMTGLLAVLAVRAQSSIDYGFAPPYWTTPISFPDDWQKTSVDNSGRLVYDFGPGPYARPTTLIAVGTKGGTLEPGLQRLSDPRAPIVETTLANTENTVRLRSFALRPAASGAMFPAPAYSRRNGYVGSVAWANPPEGTDDIFRSAAWGTGRPIEYLIDVTPGDSRRIALGFCETYRAGRIRRELDLGVEGADNLVVDLMKDGEQNEPRVFFFDATDLNGDGTITVTVAAAETTQDPNTILSGVWVFGAETAVDEGDVISGTARQKADLVIDSGRERDPAWGTGRLDAVRATIGGPATTPVVTVATRRDLVYEASTGVLSYMGNPFLTTSPRATSVVEKDGTWHLEFPNGLREIDVLVAFGPEDAGQFARLNRLDEEERLARTWWVNSSRVPWGTFSFPDKAVQDLFDGSLRVLYQNREIVDGLAQYQPGPSVYRGLWAGDAMWMIEASTMTGDPAAGRDGIDALLRYQRDDGRIVVMSPAKLLRETPHVVWALCKYARLANDQQFLVDRWGHVEAGIQWLIDMRSAASEDPDALHYGLLPPGYTDGGFGGINPEYSGVYWGLIAMKMAVRTAEWLGNNEQARVWQTEYLDFLAAFRRAAQRDTRLDASGNAFVPAAMVFDPEVNKPQQGNGHFFHALYAGEIFDRDDPLVATMYRALTADTVEGLVLGSGWMADGVWPFNAAHPAMASLWLGDSGRAHEWLTAFGNHAAPTQVWVEEQQPLGKGTRTSGDVPHTAASALWVKLARTLLIQEREGQLDLLHGLPSSWLYGGAVVEISDAPSFFGPVSLRIRVEPDGTRARLTVRPLGSGGAGGGANVHLRAFRDAGFSLAGMTPPDVWTGRWGEGIVLDFQR